MARPAFASTNTVTFPGLTNVRATVINKKRQSPKLDTGSIVGGYKESVVGLRKSAETTVNFICEAGYAIPLQGVEGTLAGDVGDGAGHCFVKSRRFKYSAGEIVGGTIVFKRCKAGV